MNEFMMIMTASGSIVVALALKIEILKRAMQLIRILQIS